MRAGLLREFLTFEKETRVISESGAVKETWIKFCTVRAWKKKLLTNEEMNAKESFLSASLTFQIRYNPQITDELRILYNGLRYKITGVDKQIQDNTIILNCTKING